VLPYKKEVKKVAWNNWNSHEGPEMEKRITAAVLTGVILGFLFSFVYVFFLAPVC
jgi:hypothetical protein